MSAMSAAISQELRPLEFWRDFCSQLESRVRDGNLLSGESVWRTTVSDSPSIGISIQHAHHPGDRVDCVFDPASSLLTCTPGPEVPLETCRFQWVDGTILRRGAEEFTVPEALTLLLDELVWPED
jgi:hypothetical protein